MTVKELRKYLRGVPDSAEVEQNIAAFRNDVNQSWAGLTGATVERVYYNEKTKKFVLHGWKI